MIASNGAISLGFSTMVQPAASAGATLTAIWLIGQSPQTPIGSFRICVVPIFSSKAKSLSAVSAALMCWVPLAAWAFWQVTRARPSHPLLPRATSSRRLS